MNSNLQNKIKKRKEDSNQIEKQEEKKIKTSKLNQEEKKEENLSKSILNHSKKKNVNRVGVIDLNFKLGFPQSIEKHEVENSIPILIRQQTQEILQKIEKNGFIKSYIFTGPPGVGKSYMLYHIADYCSKLSNWVVIYLPNIDEWINQESYVISRKIVINLIQNYQSILSKCFAFEYDTKLWDEKNPTEESKTKMISECTRLLNYLMMGNLFDIRVLVAIDEWNFLFRQERKYQEHILDIFKIIPTINQGFFLAAVSSSFHYPIDPNNSNKRFLECRIPIQIFNEAEFQSIINWLKQNDYLPQSMKDEEIEKFTARIPKLIGFLFQSYYNYRLSQKQNWLSHAHYLAEESYESMISHVLDKKKIDYDQVNFIKNIYLNSPIKYLEDEWKFLGLFKKNNQTNEFNPICESVRKAFMSVFHHKPNSYLSILASNEQSRWISVELYVFESFISKIQKSITIPNINLRGEKGKNQQEFTIFLTQQILQQPSETLDKLEPGTFLKCYRDHPAIDCIAYSTTKELFYIQISEKSYSQHIPKIDSLFETTFNRTEETILQYYSRICGMESEYQQCEFTKTKKERTIKLPANQYYIYITTSSHYYKKAKSQYSDDPVILINYENISQLNPDLWVSISKFFENEVEKHSNQEIHNSNSNSNYIFK
ncbi:MITOCHONDRIAL 28S ribosomal protein S29 [Anaeramoeba ignava]|uniref:Small ribosomal subunit protein mS29 n=1 Tax=Anaeramoeba ignava TaxID=1746090 RepID=A0A9Q0R5C6_ANAIG|nr:MITOCHONDRIAL 28S ribosomal protein S29 [Anaeramoeba ignava]